MSNDNGTAPAGATELYRRYRPKRFSDVVGQPHAVAALTTLVAEKKVPHTVLFTGGSGTGKTTLARILAHKIGCRGHLLTEVDCGDLRGIDAVRTLVDDARRSAGNAACRVWIVDEVHRLTGDAQSALLKPLEDSPYKTSYFFLATTDPDRLLKPLRGRCLELALEPLGYPDLEAVLNDVVVKEKATNLPTAVAAKLVEACGGSARKLLIDLQKVLALPDQKAQLAAIVPPALETAAMDLVRLLVWERKPTWGRAAAIIAGLGKDQEWEGLRHLVLANVVADALNKGDKCNQVRSLAVLAAFESNWFDSRKAGLIRACLEVLQSAG